MKKLHNAEASDLLPAACEHAFKAGFMACADLGPPAGSPDYAKDCESAWSDYAPPEDFCGRDWPMLEKPGQSITIGMAWDGSYYVSHTQTTRHDWLGPVTRTIARGGDLFEALDAEQQPDRS